jgi:hypothetical protein
VLPYDGVLGLLPALLAATARISGELGAPASAIPAATLPKQPTLPGAAAPVVSKGTA